MLQALRPLDSAPQPSPRLTARSVITTAVVSLVALGAGYLVFVA